MICLFDKIDIINFENARIGLICGAASGLVAEQLETSAPQGFGLALGLAISVAVTWASLLGSAVPILEALQISAQVVVNLPMRDAVQEAALRIREGAMISKSLAASKLFPPMTTHLIASGEASGRLEEMLAHAADNQKREVDGLITTMLGILQPLLVIFMAAVVLLIVLAILMPIFEMNNLIA